MTFFISDLHFGDKGIIKFERYEFETIKEHDDFIIKSVNRTVKNTDTLYILGDIGDPSKIRFLNGHKILLKGNHDKRGDKEYLGFFAEVLQNPMYLSKRLMISHYPHPVEDHIVNVHGHLHGSFVDKKNYLNVSAKMVNYTPVSEKDIQKIIEKTDKEERKFLCEWYADLYRFTKESLANRSDVVCYQNGRIRHQDTIELREKLFQR